jgi:hypothetical protein
VNTIYIKRISVVCFVIATIVALSLSVLTVYGAPGNGTSITVKNQIIGTAPNSVWSYTITELNPPKNTNAYTASFTLPAVGGSYSFGGLRSGSYKVTETSKFGYNVSAIVTSNQNSGSQIVNGLEVPVLIGSSEGKTVTFTNTGMPAFAMVGLPPLPAGLSLSIPPLKPIPVQASLNVDINNDLKLDLVLGKPMVILVSLVGTTFQLNDSITVSVLFEGKPYSRVVTASSLDSSKIVTFYDAVAPILPSIAGNKSITGIYQVNGGVGIALTATDVTVKNTNGLSLYYAGLSKTDYGNVAATLNENMLQSSQFINATYPVKNVTVTSTSLSIAGNKRGTASSPYAGMLKDAQAVAQQAQLAMGGSAVGVAIAPGNATTGYFAYHGFPGAAGVSFGPAVKGVIALDGYWTVPAHEVGHTFGLFYGVPEEYVTSPTVTATGVWASAGQWRTGYSFMSVADNKSTTSTWVNTSSTFGYLFKKLTTIPGDPQILLVNGIIHNDSNGDMRADFPLDWVKMNQGIPDTLIPGNYTLNFVKADGITISNTSISFDASFSMQITVPLENGKYTTATDAAGFSFAITYPSSETRYVQVKDIHGNILGTYDMATVTLLSSSITLEGTEGLNGWYVSDVNATITATADGSIGIKEIHYILNGTETIVPGGFTELPTIKQDGIHTLIYWGVDNGVNGGNGGNEGVHHTQTIKIDKTPPEISGAATTSPNGNLWYKTDVTVHFTASDVGGSGVASVTPNTTLTSEGAGQHVIGTAADLAGNSATYTVSGINIDKTAPTLTSSGAIEKPYAAGWYKNDVTVNFVGADNLSSLVGDASVNVVLKTEGASQSVSYTFTDAADNSATYTVSGINIDKTKPIITITTPGNVKYTVGQSVKANWSATDSLSGIASAIGTKDSGQLIDTSTIGFMTFTVTSEDQAGNTNTQTITYIVDTYIFGGFISPIANSQYEQGRTIPVKFQLTDYQSNFVTWANPTISVVDSNGTVISGSFQYNLASNSYQFSLNTKKLEIGQLIITISLNDEQSYTMEKVSLK